MARTILTPIAVPASNVNPPAGQLVTYTAWDATNGNRFACSERELVLVRNVHVATGRTVTVVSANDIFGRAGGITAFAVPFGGANARPSLVLPFFKQDGWRQADGYIWLDGSTADVEFAVLTVPN